MPQESAQPEPDAPRIRIATWNRKTKDQAFRILGEFLTEEYAAHMYHLTFIIDELVKNAIKANHKYLIMQNRIFNLIRYLEPKNPDPEGRLAEICADTDAYNAFTAAHPHLLVKLTEELIRVLQDESEILEAKDKIYLGETLTPLERKRLKKTPRHKLRYRTFPDLDHYVMMRCSKDDTSHWIEVINTAPILELDLERILNKREVFRRYLDQGQVKEFFVNEIDTSEGGSGLGYAIVDHHLLKLGLEPRVALKILSAHTTNVIVELRRSLLRSAQEIEANAGLP